MKIGLLLLFLFGSISGVASGGITYVVYKFILKTLTPDNIGLLAALFGLLAGTIFTIICPIKLTTAERKDKEVQDQN